MYNSLILNSDYKNINQTVMMTKSMYLSKLKKDLLNAENSCKALGMSLLTFENEDHCKNFMKSIESVEPRIENAFTAYEQYYTRWAQVETHKQLEIPLIFHKPPRMNYYDVIAIAYKNDEYKFSEVDSTNDHPFICELIEYSLNFEPPLINFSTINIVLFIVILLLLCVIFIFAYKKYVNKNATPAVVEEQA